MSADGQATTDAPQQDNAPASTGGASTGYQKRQVGLIGIMLIISGLLSLTGLLDGDYAAIGQCVVYVLMGLSFVRIEVADKGEYLLVTTGPCRWLECGWGKEKVKYSEIRDYQTTKTCWLSTPGVCCTGIRLMNQCSCVQCGFCGPTGSPDALVGGCCGHTTVRITVNERGFSHGASDDADCCLERCCLNNCFGAACYEEEMCGRKKGEGCCFAMCCNPCGVNCCSMNTMYVSTNDPQGLIELLNTKTGRNETVTL